MGRALRARAETAAMSTSNLRMVSPPPGLRLSVAVNEDVHPRRPSVSQRARLHPRPVWSGGLAPNTDPWLFVTTSRACKQKSSGDHTRVHWPDSVQEARVRTTPL